MEEHYLLIRTIHIGAVALSGLLFTVRATALNLFSAPWARALPLRVLSWVIDTVLLAAAVTLTTIIHQYPFVQAWLTTKVILLVTYIGLGTVALKPSRPRMARVICWAAATATFLFIVTVARAHDPMGLFAPQ
jgi:uncharacterized membrane protein SirB2